MKKKILVAMSGGVDSSVAAHLLKRKGHEVMGATIQTWAPEDCDRLNTRACCSVEGVADARGVATRLDIPYHVFNMADAFKKAVVDYFVSEYVNARTPNPCIACNQWIKFRLFLKRARMLGFDTIATGHYAQVLQDEETGRFYVKEGLDGRKDQSYVLFALSQEELSHLILPLGSLRKEEVRRIAKEENLPVFDKPDSQEICFIPSNDYAAFLKRQNAVEDQPGAIKNETGEVLGQHAGYFHYTLGQRKGLGIAHAHPLYVTRIDKEKNEVIVGSRSEALKTRFRVTQLNWMLPLRSDSHGDSHRDSHSHRFDVKIRSQHIKSAATVEKTGADEISVTFDDPQQAITPGQAAVFYEGDRVAGGGWIESVVE